MCFTHALCFVVQSKDEDKPCSRTFNVTLYIEITTNTKSVAHFSLDLNPHTEVWGCKHAGLLDF